MAWESSSICSDTLLSITSHTSGWGVRENIGRVGKYSLDPGVSDTGTRIKDLVRGTSV